MSIKIPTFPPKPQPSSGENDKNLHQERTYNEEKMHFFQFLAATDNLAQLWVSTVYFVLNETFVLI